VEYCDFVETRIKEYENAIEYYTDREHTYKGVVLYFVKKMLVAGALPPSGMEDGRFNIPHYEYMPLDIPISETEQWIYSKKQELHEEYVLYRTDYWYLDQVSCVLIQRNREWFSAVVPQFISLWETIENERVSGYSHRASVKKTKSVVANTVICVDSSTGKADTSNTSQFIRNIQTSSTGGICLIKLDEAGNNIDTQNTPSLENDSNNLFLL
jgi:hypothetical protein